MPLIKLPSSLLSTAFCICHSLSHCSCCLWRFSFKIGFLPLFSLRTIVCPTTKGSGDIVRTIITRKPLSLFFKTSFCSRSHSFCHRSSSTGLESYLSRQSSLATSYPLHFQNISPGAGQVPAITYYIVASQAERQSSLPHQHLTQLCHHESSAPSPWWRLASHPSHPLIHG